MFYAAIKLKPKSDDPSSKVRMEYAGVLTCCEFAEEEALSTVGATARLTKHIDEDTLENATAFVHIVCSVAKSRVGRSLLAQFLIDLKKSRSVNRKEAVVIVAVSKDGRELFKSFGFREVKFKGNYLMYVYLEDVTFETMTKALRFKISDEFMGVCFRHGLTRPSSNNMYPTGCK